MLMDAGEVNLCRFDSTLTFFDSSVRTFDSTTCQDVTPPAEEVVEQGGGNGGKRRRKRLGRRSVKARASDQFSADTPQARFAAERHQQQELDREIATLMKSKLRKDEEERALALLMVLMS